MKKNVHPKLHVNLQIKIIFVQVHVHVKLQRSLFSQNGSHEGSSGGSKKSILSLIRCT